eukprot:6176852-Pleurochrysis_carterae.AAC.1
MHLTTSKRKTTNKVELKAFRCSSNVRTRAMCMMGSCVWACVSVRERACACASVRERVRACASVCEHLLASACVCLRTSARECLLAFERVYVGVDAGICGLGPACLRARACACACARVRVRARVRVCLCACARASACAQVRGRTRALLFVHASVLSCAYSRLCEQHDPCLLMCIWAGLFVCAYAHE